MKAYFLWLAKLITLIFVFIVVVPLFLGVVAAIMAKSLGDDAPKLGLDKSKKIAVVEVTGIIMQSREVIEELYRQEDDATVKGIVLRVDSPGGAVGPAQEIYAAV